MLNRKHIKVKLNDVFVKAKEMVKYDLVAYLDIPDIIRLSMTCKDINSVIDLNRHNVKT